MGDDGVDEPGFAAAAFAVDKAQVAFFHPLADEKVAWNDGEFFEFFRGAEGRFVAAQELLEDFFLVIQRFLLAVEFRNVLGRISFALRALDVAGGKFLTFEFLAFTDGHKNLAGGLIVEARAEPGFDSLF